MVLVRGGRFWHRLGRIWSGNFSPNDGRFQRGFGVEIFSQGWIGGGNELGMVLARGGRIWYRVGRIWSGNFLPNAGRFQPGSVWSKK